MLPLKNVDNIFIFEGTQNLNIFQKYSFPSTTPCEGRYNFNIFNGTKNTKGRDLNQSQYLENFHRYYVFTAPQYIIQDLQGK